MDKCSQTFKFKKINRFAFEKAENASSTKFKNDWINFDVNKYIKTPQSSPKAF